MKIIIGSESFRPNISGVAVFAERMAKEMARRGHEVYIFAPSSGLKSGYDKSYHDIKVFRLRSVPNPLRGGFRIAFLPAGDVKREFERIQPDLIHIQDPTSICGALMKEARKHGVPVIATNHFGLEFIIAYIKNLKFIYPIVLRAITWYISRFYNKCTLLTTPSATARKKVIRLGTRTEVIVISNGIETNRFKPTPDPSEARNHFGLPDKPTVLYLGRIDKDKSIDVLVQAIPYVLAEIDAHFVLAGSGDKVEDIKRLVKDLRVEKSVTLLGRIEHDSPDLPKAYQAASLFAMPSCIETQSIVTLEALSSGLPLVAADATSMPEFTDNNKDGYLFTPGKPKEMAKKITAILSDDRLREKMGQGSRAYALENSIEKTYDKFELLYKEIIEMGSSLDKDDLAKIREKYEKTASPS